jgi:HAD superfamily phosphoserine phosphatase-like hydrolase
VAELRGASGEESLVCQSIDPLPPPHPPPSAISRSVNASPLPGVGEGRRRALLDFDGTVAPGDPTDRIMERFAGQEWLALEAAWQSGRMTSRECMQRQAALLRATPRQLDAAIRAVDIDPGFPAFVGFCRRRGVDIAIVSDGFDRVVHTLLQRARLPVPFFANALQWQGGDRWCLGLPHSRPGCSAANCKCAHARWDDGRTVVIGDGRSDFCMAARAGFVIAKGALAEFCRARGLAHAPFRTFEDATERLAEWLGQECDRRAVSRLRRRPAGARHRAARRRPG